MFTVLQANWLFSKSITTLVLIVPGMILKITFPRIGQFPFSFGTQFLWITVVYKLLITFSSLDFLVLPNPVDTFTRFTQKNIYKGSLNFIPKNTRLLKQSILKKVWKLPIASCFLLYPIELASKMSAINFALKLANKYFSWLCYSTSKTLKLTLQF